MPIAPYGVRQGRDIKLAIEQDKKYLSDHDTEAFTLEELVHALEDPKSLTHFWQRDQIEDVYSDTLILLAADGEIDSNVVSTPMGLANIYFSTKKK